MRTFVKTVAFALLAGLALLAAKATAAPRELLIDSQNSVLNFTSKTAFVDVDGKFDYWTGVIEFDAQAPLKSTVKVRVDAKTINTENRTRDKHLRSDDFFGVDKYPEIQFASKNLRKLPEGEDRYEVTGDLTIRGITREIIFPAEIAVKDDVVHARAEIEIKRRDFGIDYRSYFNPISNDVKIRFDIHTNTGMPTGSLSNSR